MIEVNGTILFNHTDIRDLFAVDSKDVTRWKDKGMLPWRTVRNDGIFAYSGITLETLRNFIRKYGPDAPDGGLDILSGFKLRADSDVVFYALQIEKNRKKRNHRDLDIPEEHLNRVKQFNEACLTPSELSAILSIDYNTICKWCRDGIIKSYMGHSGQKCGSRAIFYEDFKAFIFDHPKKWNRVQDGEVNDKKRRYKIQYLMCGILRDPGKKRFYDLYLNECRRLTYESEGF